MLQPVSDPSRSFSKPVSNGIRPRHYLHRSFLIGLLSIASTSGCSGNNSDQASPLPGPIVEVTEPPDLGISVRRLAVNFDQPLYVTDSGDDSGRLMVVEKTGRIRLLDIATGTINAQPFIDLSESVSSGGEQGLLGLALAPDFATSGQFYVNLTNLTGDTEVRRYQRSQADPDQADLASEDVVFTLAQFAENHNGGWIDFGPDGLLYIATGDGGGAGDPANHGQDSATLLGAILRIDPGGDEFPNDPNQDYAIPAGNPFSNAGGAPEIFAYGLRNPFRASFDRLTGNLYIGDVGQDEVEEIDLVPNGLAGLNFGWNILEGTQMFTAGPVAGLQPPLAEYRHGSGPLQGNSVTGGVVYRGPIEALRGHYIFGDFATNNIWSIDVDALDLASPPTIAATDFQIRTDEFIPDVGTFDGLSSFGEDAAGNLYITDIDGDLFVVETGE